jgi:hypothetical protein
MDARLQYVKFFQDENKLPVQREGKSRLGKILSEKSKLNLSISKRSRRIHSGANKSGKDLRTYSGSALFCLEIGCI